MTNPRATHFRSNGRTACGRVLGARLRGGSVFMNGTHKLVTSESMDETTCGKCREQFAIADRNTRTGRVSVQLVAPGP